MKESRIARQVENQASSDKTQPSRKRKRTARDASLDKWADNKAAAIVKPAPSKKSRKRNENRTPPLSYPDPAVDEGLSQQSRRALLYAYERCQVAERWKFNKARQNWLLRNVWSEQAVPETYVPLVIQYLIGIKGGAREKLVAECTSKLYTSHDELVKQGTSPFDDSNNAGSIIREQSSSSRALSILNALRAEEKPNL